MFNVCGVRRLYTWLNPVYMVSVRLMLPPPKMVVAEGWRLLSWLVVLETKGNTYGFEDSRCLCGAARCGR